MEKKNHAPINSMYAVLTVVALAVFGVGIFLAVQDVPRRDWSLLAAGCLGLLIVLSAWTHTLSQAIAREAAIALKLQDRTAMADRLQGISVILNEMSEQQLLSDRAKVVAYREKDRDALRRAIRDDIAKRDWEAAMVLANDMEEVFGYRQEAVTFREEIHRHQQEVFRKQIKDGIDVIDRHCRFEGWSEALREAERLMSAFRGDEMVMQLPTEIENRRQTHKRQLVETFNESLNRKDVDGGIEILKKLDPYLTRAEADDMQDIVRNLFKDKLNNLKTQFALAIQDHKHVEASRLAETIVRDFPNSGMAKELVDKLDMLRQRAIEPAEAAV